MADQTDTLTKIHEELALVLLEKLRAKDITPAEMKVALDLCKHNSIYGGDPKTTDSPIRQILDAVPFTSVDQELPSRPVF